MLYIINVASVLELDMQEVLEDNINKLRKRYPQGFDADRSINR